MQRDKAEIDFGNFLRWKFSEAGGVAYACRKVGLSTTTVERFFRSPDPESLNIRQDNKDRLAEATGFGSWAALDIAWRDSPRPPYPLKPVTAPRMTRVQAERESGRLNDPFGFKAMSDEQLKAASVALSNEIAKRKSG